jgi:hypothetical protein
VSLDPADDRLLPAAEVEAVRRGGGEARLRQRVELRGKVRGAAAIGIPIVVTEQYPKGLGETVEEIGRHLPAGTEPLAKTVFSAAAAEGFDLGDREQAIVCGIEAHVCVNQTVLDLLDRGIEVHVVTDAVGSRSAANRELGLAKAERAGAWPTSVEMALFELLGEAGTDDFKQVQRLVLELAP